MTGSVMPLACSCPRCLAAAAFVPAPTQVPAQPQVTPDQGVVGSGPPATGAPHELPASGPPAMGAPHEGTAPSTPASPTTIGTGTAPPDAQVTWPLPVPLATGDWSWVPMTLAVPTTPVGAAAPLAAPTSQPIGHDALRPPA